MPRSRTAGRATIVRLGDDSSDSAEEDNEVDSDHTPRKQGVPRQASSPASAKSKDVIVIHDDDEDSDEDEDEDDDLPLLPSSTQRRRPVLPVDDDESSEEDVVQSPAKKRRIARQPVVDSDGSDGSDNDVVASSRPRRIAARRSTSSAAESSPTPAAPVDTPGRRQARKGHRTAKQKQMELLRRRRAGEDIDKLTSSSEDDEDQGGLYDTDSDLVALSEFEDDEEPDQESEEEPPVSRGKKSSKISLKKSNKALRRDDRQNSVDNSNESDLDDFVVEDDEGPIGVPDHLLEIPLQFTAHAHKPLKEHFKDVIEWLVHRRINPSFDRENQVYRIAWGKLNDEVSGLAQSKFASSAWRPDFIRTMRARPRILQAELPPGHLSELHGTCDACGRSNHPASWVISFAGSPYDKDTLDDLESDDEDEDDDEDGEGHVDYDENGNRLPPESKEWFVGATCNSNAETAHNLMHWKYALMDYVESRLRDEGWLDGQKLEERERMKPKKRRKLADGIVDDWERRLLIKHLYGDFKSTLELARAKSTVVRPGRRR
ncbi:hypothetical protein UCRPA7_8324 [Phaeoacremonium minimum UCRPA7]|uniref:DUF4211 domain-containing protein n=1 Tax=Phaeoacremonium minimum (strain UCR-PA7) TaxID=1286976 RepID=R8BA38_PHAM7|nr:hypothetical protein UCRPA7_8324 [Phaeoacremonium minimum UCRPA7]EON96184.1 hypothetical protein UCRPA7_8324 [Phaeoacremonium minimum UCRPA7]